jgi:hypothetical protein
VLLFTNHDISSCHRILAPLFDRADTLPEYVSRVHPRPRLQVSVVGTFPHPLCLLRERTRFVCHILCLRWCCPGPCSRSALCFSVGLLLLEVYIEWQLPGMTYIGLLTRQGFVDMHSSSSICFSSSNNITKGW